jgi:chromosome partitioning protein
MTKTIAIANRKGGVGKTATAHAVGAGLRIRGYKVLLVDLDSQCNLTTALLGEDEEPELTSLDVLQRDCTASEAIIETGREDLLPASEALSVADKEIDGVGKEYRLKEALEELGSSYDYIIVDTPPALGVLTVNALTASDSLIIPAQADTDSLRGVIQLAQTVDVVRKYTNPRLTIEGILLTRYNSRTILSRDMRENLEAVASELGSVVYETPIRECTAIKEAKAMCIDVYTYAPKSNASLDYNALIDQITK